MTATVATANTTRRQVIEAIEITRAPRPAEAPLPAANPTAARRLGGFLAALLRALAVAAA